VRPIKNPARLPQRGQIAKTPEMVADLTSLCQLERGGEMRASFSLFFKKGKTALAACVLRYRSIKPSEYPAARFQRLGTPYLAKPMRRASKTLPNRHVFPFLKKSEKLARNEKTGGNRTNLLKIALPAFGTGGFFYFLHYLVR
jgi:hypothetical protein